MEIFQENEEHFVTLSAGYRSPTARRRYPELPPDFSEGGRMNPSSEIDLINVSGCVL